MQPFEVFELAPPLDLSFVGTLVNDGPNMSKFAPTKMTRPKGFSADPWAFLEKSDLVQYHPFDNYDMVKHFALAMNTVICCEFGNATWFERV